MEGLSAQDLLAVWEEGRGRSPVERGLALLARACPQLDAAARRALPLSERDRLLLELRARTFGPQARLRAACPACELAQETSLDVWELAAHANTPEDGEPLGRAPSSEDLLALPADLAPDQAARELVRRCAPAPAESADDQGGWLEALLERHPLLDVRLAFTCVGCGARWEQGLDAVALLWAEVEAHARRLLLEVDELARAYGWSEAAVLSLSPLRRATYLALVRT